MKVKELEEIIEFFKSRSDDDDDGKAEYFKILLQAENLKLMSDMKKEIKNSSSMISDRIDDVIGAIESRLWPLVSLYDLDEEQEKQDDTE